MREGLGDKAQGIGTIGLTTVLVAVVFSVWGERNVPAANAASPAMVINEIMWAGSTVSASDEWIELYNPGDSEIDVSGWLLEKAGGRSSPGLELPVGALIPAGGYYLIANFAADHASSAFDVEVDYVTASLALLNDGNGNLVLKDETGAMIDQAGGDPWFEGENSSGVKKSTERGVEVLDGLLAASWHSATETRDQKNYGTPRAQNSRPAVNVVPEAVIAGATSALVGQAITLSGEDSSDADDGILAYAWSWGDGTTASGVSASHAFGAAGKFAVVLTVSDGQTEAEAQHVVSVTAPVYSNAVVINEFLPNPAGSDTENEFIELKNTGNEEVDLSGWRLDDMEGGSAPYAFPAGTVMGAGSVKVFLRSESKIALNNTGDSVRLRDPAGVVKSAYTYTASGPEGQSYNRTVDGSYVISTTPTPGTENVMTVPVDEDEEDDAKTEKAAKKSALSSASSSGKIAGAAVKSVALADIREEEEGTSVTAEGVVSVPPGFLGERILYVAGSGIQIYWHEGKWPLLKLGDKISVTGKLGSSLGEARLKVSGAEFIKKVAGGEPPTPHVLETGDINEDREGWLVTVQGEVVKTSGDTFYIDDGSGEVKIYIKETTHIDKPKMKQGVAVTITGVVSETSSGYRVLPRFQEDVRLGRVAGLTTFPETGYFLWMLFGPALMIGVPMLWPSLQNR